MYDYRKIYMTIEWSYMTIERIYMTIERIYVTIARISVTKLRISKTMFFHSQGIYIKQFFFIKTAFISTGGLVKRPQASHCVIATARAQAIVAILPCSYGSFNNRLNKSQQFNVVLLHTDR